MIKKGETDIFNISDWLEEQLICNFGKHNESKNKKK